MTTLVKHIGCPIFFSSDPSTGNYPTESFLICSWLPGMWQTALEPRLQVDFLLACQKRRHLCLVNNWTNSFLMFCLLKWSRRCFSAFHNDGWYRTCSNNSNKHSYSTSKLVLWDFWPAVFLRILYGVFIYLLLCILGLLPCTSAAWLSFLTWSVLWQYGHCDGLKWGMRMGDPALLTHSEHQEERRGRCLRGFKHENIMRWMRLTWGKLG